MRYKLLGAALAAPVLALGLWAVPASADQTVLEVSGSGIKSTETFHVEDDWDLRYSYDCSDLGAKGNFQVYEHTDGTLSGVLVNELGKSGEGVTHEHGGEGEKHLKVNSTCDWSLSVVDLSDGGNGGGKGNGNGGGGNTGGGDGDDQPKGNDDKNKPAGDGGNGGDEPAPAPQPEPVENDLAVTG